MIASSYKSYCQINANSESVNLRNDSLEFYRYSIKYPRDAQSNSIEGTVMYTIDIDSTCSIINRRLIKKLGYGCEEAVNETLNTWQKDMKKKNKSKCKPGKDLSLPVNFRLR